MPFQPGMLAVTFNTHADAYFDQPNDILSVIISLAPKVCINHTFLYEKPTTINTLSMRTAYLKIA